MATVKERRRSINKKIFGDDVEASDKDLAIDLQSLEFEALTAPHTVPSPMQSAEVS